MKGTLISIFVVFIVLMSSCVPRVKLFTLEVVSDPDTIGIVLLDEIEQTELEPSDIRLTPFSISLKPEERVVIRVVDEEPKQELDEIHVFYGWSDGSEDNPRIVTVDSNKKLEAKTLTKFKVTVSTDPKKLIEIPGSGWYEKGSSLTLTAPHVENYTFNGWNVNGETINDNPLVITVDKPTKIEAVYSEIPFRTLSVGSEPEGLKIIIDSLEYTSPSSIQAREGTSHTIEFKAQERDESSFVSGIDTRYTFKSWNDSNTSNPRTVLLDSDKSYTVQTETQYLVETSTLPEGVASIDGAGWKVKDSLFSYVSPDSIGYDFSHWEVNGIRIDGRSVEITHDSPKKIVAVYTLKGYRVNVNTEPSGLEVKVNGVKKVAPANVVVNHGDTVSLEIVTPQERDESGNVEGIDTRYSFTKWNDGSTAKARTITVTENVLLTAQMKSEHLVNVSSSVVSIPGSGWYEKGSSLTLTAPHVENYTFNGWNVNGETINDNPLVITVDKPTKIEAVYSEIPFRTLSVGSEPEGLKIIIDSLEYTSPSSIQAREGTSHTIEFKAQERDESSFVSGIDTRYTFKSWNDSNTSNPRTVLLDSDKSYTVQTETQYLVETSTLPEGVASIDGAGWKVKDSLFSYVSPDSIGYDFSHWEVNGIRIDGRSVEITHDSPKKIVAVYTLKGYRVNVNTEPSGLEVKVNGVKKVAPANVVVNHGDTVSVEIVTPQERDESSNVEGMDTRYSFTKWSDGSTAKVRTITVTENVLLTAQMKSEHLVNVSSSVVSIPGSGWYEKGSSLTLTAPHVENYTFNGWNVNGETINDNPLVITVDKPTKIEAVYSEIPFRTLSVGSEPEGLKIIIDSLEYTSPSSIQAREGTSHTIEFKAQERDESSFVSGIDTRYTFKSWNDSNTSNPRTVLLDSDKSYTVQTETRYLVETSTLPEGVASIDGAGWKVKDSLFSYVSPDSIGYDFSHWEVNGIRIDGRSVEITHDSPKKIVAVYTLKGYRVNVNTEPSGLEVKVNGVKKVAPANVVVNHGDTVSLEIVTPQERDESGNVEGIDTRYSFTKWNDGSTAKARTITVTENVLLTAQMKSEHLVSVSSSVVSIPGSGWYEKGSSLTLTAPQVEGYSFLNWTVNGETLNDNPLQINVDSPKKLIARYNTIPTLEIPDQTVNTGTNLVLDLRNFASDSDGDPIVFSKVSGVGTISGNQFSYNANTAGTYSVTVRASDGRGGEATDTFSITVVPSNNAPLKPSSPNPANNASDVVVSITLSWNCSDPDGDSLKYDVYFGESSNPSKVASGITTKSYNPGNLQNGKDYYWKIVATDAKGATTQGDVWKFRTADAEIPPEDGIDMNGPVYTGNVLLISNESESANTTEYTGTLSSDYLPSGDVLPKNLPIEAYAINPEIPLPDDIDLSMKMRPDLVEAGFELAAVGSTRSFHVRNFKTNLNYQITATLQYIGETCEIWVENPSEITVSKATQLGQEFDNVIYPLVTEYFYTPSDVNGDGRVAILCFDIQDDFDNTGAYVGGYFSSGDLFNTSTSNKMEIFYIDTYPTMRYPASNPVDVSRAYSTLVHEFQHMVNFNRNYFVENSSSMPTWLNEGLSMAAEHIYKGTLTSRISYYNYATSIKNGQSLLYWNDNGDVLANYSLSYLFLQYVRTQGGGDPAIFKDILLDSCNDQRAVTVALAKRGVNIGFGDLMTAFRIALLLKKPTGLYGFRGDSSFDGITVSYYTGGAKNLRGGSAIFKTINPSFTDPGNSGSSIQYVGICK